MTAATDVLSPRKEDILRAVVECYIASSSPVGSGTVSATQHFDVSPATIRKEMLGLEQAGYLHQPHTSSGRIPTEAGYRYFVDSLMEPYSLDSAEHRQIADFFDGAHGELGTILGSLSSLLAEVTHCAAVVVGPRADLAVVRSVQLVELSSHVLLAVAVLSTGAVEQRFLELDDPSLLSGADLERAGDLLAQGLVGHPVDSEVPTPGETPAVCDIVRRAGDALGAGGEGSIADHLFVGGQAAVVRSFGVAEAVQRILALLEHQYAVVTLLRDILGRDMRVAIGGETGLVPLAECAVVVSPYVVAGRHAGSVAVLGPTHLNYPQAMATVAVTSSQLGKLLTGG